jgi:hypothetical protein
MNAKKQILWITQTAMFLGMTVAAQYYLTALMGGPGNPASQIAVGSLVNLFLILATLSCGFWSGASVGVIAPFAPLLLGRLPHILLVPFIALGNIALVLVFWLACEKKISGSNFTANWAAASVAGALLKFGVLWLGVTQIALKLFLNDSLPPRQIEMLTFTFSLPQLATALTGSLLAYAIYPVLKKITAGKTADAKN